MKTAGIHTEDETQNAIVAALEGFDPTGMTEGQLTAVRRLAFLAESYADTQVSVLQKGKSPETERHWLTVGDLCAEVWGKVLREIKWRD